MTFWKSVLYLETGQLFEGQGFGVRLPSGGEVVFNTGMTGYQEIMTDPSYAQQMVVMGGVHCGNTGINFEDIESHRLYLKGFIVREYTQTPSSWRSQRTLHSYLEEHGVAGISDVDTREITQILRDQGAQRGVIFPIDDLKPNEILPRAKELLESVPSMEGLELVSQVSCREPYEYAAGTSGKTAIVYDYGTKTNILRNLEQRGFKVVVVPHNFPHTKALEYRPAVVVLSNGPGDPAKVEGATEQVQSLIGKVPIFGICMGHQILARALGLTTFKLKFGHHGINHPVLDTATGKIIITSQNHGFAVQEWDKKLGDVRVSHINLNDRTVQGLESKRQNFLSVQFHPESKPGPTDASTIFDRFLGELK